MSTKVHMHQTTVRFGRDLWEVLEQEAGRLGVSAAQYVRDATLARLAYAAARQDEAVASREAFEWAGEGVPEEGLTAPVGSGLEVPLVDGPKAPLVKRVEAQLDSAIALQAEGKLARDRAERLRMEAEELRKRKAGGRKR